MLTSLLRIFTQEKEKQRRFIVNNFMNQPTNGNILWDVTHSRVSMGLRLSKIFFSFYKDKFCDDLTYLLQYDILQQYVTYLLQ